MPTEETAGAPLQMEDKSWGEVVAVVQRKSPTLGAVLQSARWRQEGAEIIVSLTSKFYQEKLEQPASREMVHLAISECGLVASGVELKVRYVLDEGHLKNRAQVDPGLVSEIFG